VARSRLRCEDDICDAVQNTLISAYKYLNTLKEEKYFKTWLIKILINKCNDLYINFERDTIPIDTVELHKIVAIDDFTNNSSIDYLINSLGKDEQTILNLYYLEGYSEKEISEIMNINYATVRTKMKRAKERIATKYNEEVI